MTNLLSKIKCKRFIKSDSCCISLITTGGEAERSIDQTMLVGDAMIGTNPESADLFHLEMTRIFK